MVAGNKAAEEVAGATKEHQNQDNVANEDRKSSEITLKFFGMPFAWAVEARAGNPLGAVSTMDRTAAEHAKASAMSYSTSILQYNSLR